MMNACNTCHFNNCCYIHELSDINIYIVEQSAYEMQLYAFLEGDGYVHGEFQSRVARHSHEKLGESGVTLAY